MRTALLVVSMLILASFTAYFVASFSAYLILLTVTPSPAPSITEVHLNFHDYATRKAISGLAVNFNITTRDLNTFMVSGISDEYGSIVQALPTSNIALPVSAENISISGKWVLEETEGEEALSVADKKWVATNPMAFSYGYSEYIFDEEVHPSSELSGATRKLRFVFYLASGKVLGVYNPIPEARSFDRRLVINFLSCNFVEFEEASYAVVPIREPLIADLEASYYMMQWKIHISVDTGNRSFVDLTPSFIRAVSSAQVEELARSLDNLKPYGFGIDDLYNKIDEISELYDLAAIEVENGNYESFWVHIQSAANSYRDLYTQITGIYMNGLGWIPSLVIIYLFFSLALSRLVSERRGYSIILFLTSFLAVFCLSLFTQPYLILFISNPLVLVQSFTMPVIYLILFQFLPFLIFATAMFFPNMKSFVRETFGVGIRNLRRRKLKTILALLTVVIVSASAMCFLTITTERQILQVPFAGVEPTVDRGLTIRKTMTQTNKIKDLLDEPRTISFNLPIQDNEVKWFSEHEWVEDLNIYGIRKVRFARADGFTIEDFNTFSLVITNASFVAKHQNISNVIGVEWFDETERNMVIIGSKIAEAYNLEAGDEVLINDRRYIVKSIVNEQTLREKLKDIDGDPFLSLGSNLASGDIVGGSFIFGTLDDFKEGSFSTYKISIILKNEYAQDVAQIARDIQGMGYDFGETEDYYYVVTYSVRAISPDFVYIVYSSAPVVMLSGQLYTQIIPIIITTLVLVVNALGAVTERRSEVRTVYTIGASPIRVGFIFITEGLVLGIMGGIFGYIFGYLLVQYADIALPTLVKENMVGGSPFTIAISTATLASLLGCLMPAMRAIRMAVPSGRLRQRTKDIIEIREGVAYLEIPVKIEEIERDLFRRFLGDLANEYALQDYPSIRINPFAVDETEEGTLYKIAINYRGDEAANFLVSILAKPNENLRVTIYPIEDSETKKVCRWRREHKNIINKLSPFLRGELLRFAELKRKKSTSGG